MDFLVWIGFYGAMIASTLLVMLVLAQRGKGGGLVGALGGGGATSAIGVKGDQMFATATYYTAFAWVLCCALMVFGLNPRKPDGGFNIGSGGGAPSAVGESIGPATSTGAPLPSGSTVPPASSPAAASTAAPAATPAAAGTTEAASSVPAPAATPAAPPATTPAGTK